MKKFKLPSELRDMKALLKRLEADLENYRTRPTSNALMDAVKRQIGELRVRIKSQEEYLERQKTRDA
jgi:hypothetical protein